MDPVHRDDIDYRVVEKLEKLISEKFPNFKLSFAGDDGDMKVARETQEVLDRLLAESRCYSCGLPAPVDMNHELSADERRMMQDGGWVRMATEDDRPISLVCSDCMEKKMRGEVLPVFGTSLKSVSVTVTNTRRLVLPDL